MSTISSGLALRIRLTSIVLRQISEKILFIKLLCKYHWIGAQMSLFSGIKFSWRKFRKRFALVLSSKGNISNITSSDILIKCHSERSEENFQKLCPILWILLWRRILFYFFCFDCPGPMLLGFPMSILQQQWFQKKYFQRNNIIEDWTCCSSYD